MTEYSGQAALENFSKCFQAEKFTLIAHSGGANKNEKCYEKAFISEHWYLLAKKFQLKIPD